MTELKISFSHYCARIGLASAVLFLVLLTILHFIEPEFDPSRRMISEYELGHFGWLMSLAFFSLGVSVFAMLLSTWSLLATRSGLIGRWLFLVICIAFIGAGIFYPYTPPNIASYIHGICGLIVILTFPVAATLYNSGLTRNREWIASQGRLRWVTLLVWAGLLLFFGSIVIFHPVTTEDKTNLIVGWQNRFMIFTYSLWLIVVTWKVISYKSNSFNVSNRRS